MRKLLSALVVLFAFWLALSFNVQPAFLVVGALLTALVAVITLSRQPCYEWMLNPLRLLYLLLYVPYFVYYCVKANLDVAYRVLHPDVPIKPGIVKVTTELKSDLAKTFLANSITLTPGTLTVDMVGQDLYVHWINVHTSDPQEQATIIVRRFEGFLKRIFE